MQLASTRILVSSTLAVALGAAVSYWYWSSHFGPQQLLASHWRERIVSMPTAQAMPYLNRLAQLDTIGTEMLVDLLASQRPSLARQAGQMLHRQLEQWSHRPAPEASANVAFMAKQLAQRSSTMNNSALSIAADLAREILQWPIAMDRVKRLQVVDDCQITINCWLAHHARQPAAAPMSEPIVAASSSQSNLNAAAREQIPPVVPPPLPGGGLAVDPIQLPPLPPSLAAASNEPSDKSQSSRDEPRQLPILGHELPREIDLPNRQEPDHLPDRLMPGKPSSSANREQANTPHSSTSRQQGAVAGAPSAVSAESAKLSDLDLVKRLNNSDARVAFYAATELIRRGLTRTDLEFAHQFLEPDPEVRLRLLQRLEQLPIAKSRWLIWFSMDSDPRVRRAAAVRMATAQDPQLRRRLAEMAACETDAHLRTELIRWTENTKGALAR